MMNLTNPTIADIEQLKNMYTNIRREIANYRRGCILLNALTFENITPKWEIVMKYGYPMGSHEKICAGCADENDAKQYVKAMNAKTLVMAVEYSYRKIENPKAWNLAQC